jgi:hypothetical protein
MCDLKSPPTWQQGAVHIHAKGDRRLLSTDRSALPATGRKARASAVRHILCSGLRLDNRASHELNSSPPPGTPALILASLRSPNHGSLHLDGARVSVSARVARRVCSRWTALSAHALYVERIFLGSMLEAVLGLESTAEAAGSEAGPASFRASSRSTIRPSCSTSHSRPRPRGAHQHPATTILARYQLREYCSRS